MNMRVEVVIKFPLDIYLTMWLPDGVAIVFSFLRDLHAIFHKGYTNSHSHWSCFAFVADAAEFLSKTEKGPYSD